MTKHTERLLHARLIAPFGGEAFDAWFLPLVLESLEPLQLDVIEWLILGDSGDLAWSTLDLCEHIGSTPTRIGSCTSDLRVLGLITTDRRADEHGQQAYHTAVPWVHAARRYQNACSADVIRAIIQA